MKEAWRWFGPEDPVTLDNIRQTGATDVVSALYHIPASEAWQGDEIAAYKDSIEGTSRGQSPLKWSVVESIPVHEHIKMGRSDCQQYVLAFTETMKNLAACGIKTICYNFMPVIDATRTDLEYALPSGATALRFDQTRYAIFDLFILKREEAKQDYSESEINDAGCSYERMSEQEIETLSRNITAGLPGKMTDAYDLEEFRQALAQYRDIDEATLRHNLHNFLGTVLPEAEKLGVKLAIHPDDPPRGLFGLPRIICTSSDLEQLFTALPSPSNGVTLCVGTFGSRPDNDLPAMAGRFGPRIHFVHLRGIKRDDNDPRSFYEAAHLEGDVDMIDTVRNLLNEEQSRKLAADESFTEIFMRPDHGHQMMDDLKKQVNPGYSGIGRLRGLAEMRGVIRALEHVHE